jgi:oxygen-independent coproporphyrinogen-3 oxidase
MPSYHPDLLAMPIPRYTSYPTAVEFHGGIGASHQAEALAAIAPHTPVSLYVHIPYCHEICWYCGCTTGAIGRPARLESYVAALAREIDTVAARMRGQVVSVHFGGGSPNALPPHAFVALVQRLRARFDCAPDLAIAVELDPRTLDRSYADALAQAGVTRASLGVQTFAAHVQRRINRIQPQTLVAQVVTDLRAAGIAAINFDLLYGLPGQSVLDVDETVAAALDLGPDRIAMFGYAHMPRLLPRQRAIDENALPEVGERFAQSVLAAERILAAGYVAVGFDHFARPADSLAVAAGQGRLRRNFQGFTDEPATAIVGLGASAISQFEGLLVQNEKHVGRYRLRAANGGMAAVRGVLRNDMDRLRAAVIERLLCDGDVDVARLAGTFDRSADALADARPMLRSLAARGLVAISGWRIAIPPEARAYGRVAASAFDASRSV